VAAGSARAIGEETVREEARRARSSVRYAQTTARGRARAIGEKTVRGRASGATGEENSEGGGEECSGDGEAQATTTRRARTLR
jgi:hypothetical protein